MRFIVLALLAVPELASAAVGDKLADRVTQDFFTFFNWEDASQTASDGGTVHHYVQKKASQFYQQVELDVTVDATDHITAMELRCVKPFTQAYGGVFAQDVLTSFLREADREPLAKEVGGLVGGSGSVSRDGVSAGWSGDWLVVKVGGSTATPAPAASSGGWHDMFLAQDEMYGLSMTQDTRDQGPDPGDDDFGKLGGKNSGFAVWMSEDAGASVWRVVDIRFEFPTEAAAKAYIEAQLPALSEGMPVAKGVTPIGQDGHVFGGPRTEPMFGMQMNDYNFVFRTGRYVTKLYVAEGPTVAVPGSLTPDMASRIAQKADAHVKAKSGG